MTASELLEKALFQINALAAGEHASGLDADFALGELNDMLDEWAARRVYAYAMQFNQYTLKVNHQPHTIGPTGDFVVTQRPMRIQRDGANLVLTTSNPAVDVPIRVRDADWWNSELVKGLTSTIPTDLYYEPDFPNGKLFIWPVPTTAYDIRLETWGILSPLAALNTSFSMPPGYLNAVKYSLAERLTASFGLPMPPALPELAARARQTITANNSGSPRIASADSGISGKSRGSRPTFNYYSGR